MRKVLIFVFFLPLFCQAQFVNRSDAAAVAANFYNERHKSLYPDSSSDPQISSVEAVSVGGQVLYYAFNFSPDGFLLLSARAEAYPVIAYGFESHWGGESFPPALEWWMKRYEHQLYEASLTSDITSAEVSLVWQKYLSPSFTPEPVKSLAPLLHTKWNQGHYYNHLCPFDTLGPGGRTYAGCVATAIGQVMNYYRWPRQGVGAYSYQHNKYGTISADFSTATYNWNEMPSAIVRTNLAVAELLHHIGVSVDMVYGPNGSGMYNHKAAYVMRTYFKYDTSTVYLFRDTTTLNWKAVILDHLDKKMPMYYAGWTADSLIGTSGHAFVCDGYQDTSYFHFNWGWGGFYDGYFMLDNLTPGSSVFNYGQELVINSYPDTMLYSYPSYCGLTDTLKTTEGIIDDGSGPLYNYADNQHCFWLIAPDDSIQRLRLEFKKLKTEAGADLVKIYDGPTTSSPLLGTFSGSVIPPVLYTTGPVALVEFVTNGSVNDEGFMLHYNVVFNTFCSGIKTLTSPSGTFSDGSGTYPYRINSFCRWHIEPPQAEMISLQFTDFDIFPFADYVRVIDGNTSHIYGEFKGSTAPPLIIANTSKLRVLFYSNQADNAQGFKAWYTSSLAGVNMIKGLKHFIIYPNPASDFVAIEYSSETSADAVIELLDYTGRVVKTEIFKQNQGKNSPVIDISGLSKGVYLLRYRSGSNHEVRQLIRK